MHRGTEVSGLSEGNRRLVWRSPLGVRMLMEDFFEAVDRAFIEEAARIRHRAAWN
jgi:hypothetical protein